MRRSGDSATRNPHLFREIDKVCRAGLFMSRNYSSTSYTDELVAALICYGKSPVQQSTAFVYACSVIWGASGGCTGQGFSPRVNPDSATATFRARDRLCTTCYDYGGVRFARGMDHNITCVSRCPTEQSRLRYQLTRSRGPNARDSIPSKLGSEREVIRSRHQERRPWWLPPGRR